MPRVKPQDRRFGRIGPVLEFMRVMWALDHGLNSTSKRMHRTLGVTGPQRLAIRVIGKYPGITAIELAELLHVHRSSMVGVLQRLVRGGIVQRQRDPKDARRLRLTLTRIGERLDTQRAGTIEAAVRRVLMRLSKREVHEVGRILGSLASELLSQGETHGARRKRSAS